MPFLSSDPARSLCEPPNWASSFLFRVYRPTWTFPGRLLSLRAIHCSGPCARLTRSPTPEPHRFSYDSRRRHRNGPGPFLRPLRIFRTRFFVSPDPRSPPPLSSTGPLALLGSGERRAPARVLFLFRLGMVRPGGPHRVCGRHPHTDTFLGRVSDDLSEPCLTVKFESTFRFSSYPSFPPLANRTARKGLHVFLFYSSSREGRGPFAAAGPVD